MENPVSAAAEDEMGDSTGNNSTCASWPGVLVVVEVVMGCPVVTVYLEMSTASTSPSLTRSHVCLLCGVLFGEVPRVKIGGG